MRLVSPSLAAAGAAVRFALCLGTTARAATTVSAVTETLKIRPTDPPPPAQGTTHV
jgi:hypothetical protein